MDKKKINLKDPTSRENSHSRFGRSFQLSKNLKKYFPAIISLILLLTGILINDLIQEPVKIIWYILVYMPVGFPVIKEGWKNILKGNFFTEFFLMSVATIGAFAIGEYPEAVAVMLFYSIGELFQSAAVTKAKNNIKSLLDVRPKEARTYKNGKIVKMVPEKVEIGDKIQVRAGEKVALDGVLLSEKASLNTAAITGESKPDVLKKGEQVYASSINLENVIEVEVTKKFEDSSIARILHMVQTATTRKSKTELFIRKFAKVYTPIVVFTAVGLTFVPYLFTDDYVFTDWLYRALIFLVVSCPCALIISIPLGYFGGLGAASKNCILFKGASFLDAITKITTLVTDKTGTLTKGVFKVKSIKAIDIDETELMRYLQAIEEQSTHPIAKAILTRNGKSIYKAQEVTEIAGKGLKGRVNNKKILAGSSELMKSHNVHLPRKLSEIVESVVFVAIDNHFSGYIIIADEVKEDAKIFIEKLHKTGIKDIRMLSGDKDSVTQKVARELGIENAKGGLLPEDKLHEIEKIIQIPGAKVAFVGDGINDAPVMAASHVGIAMGGLGSDVAIETADVIIQTDQPSKIVQAVKIGRATRKVVWQNMVLAFGVKLIVLALGAGGLATMWEAVFADVGVALLAILNAVRLQRMSF
ncbi:heavy metal translocating P-type ATPase [Abyssalbus ytuae]|uniref:P-type Zn(2+) transporter n=1 Tax=Abyssalbus ytuae TaxID=2926907 RepID=A0A9E6ZNB0_9FLAO|nr:heavy metal translocating P-type ATPase [Abyssalbus ytuae]UOB17460.1 cadmium-translocating P-type ATPase [Abyssalbus ytuae]